MHSVTIKGVVAGPRSEFLPNDLSIYQEPAESRYDVPAPVRS